MRGWGRERWRVQKQGGRGVEDAWGGGKDVLGVEDVGDEDVCGVKTYQKQSTFMVQTKQN